MAYSVDTYSGSRTFVVEDGTIDSSLDIRLIGKNYAGYGEVQNENFLHLLENFAGLTAPPRPINGQLWYDVSTKKMRFWDSASLRWKSPGGTEVSFEAPAGLTVGDLWWDQGNSRLYGYNGTSFVLVGPPGVNGFGSTEVRSLSVTDTANTSHAIMAAYVDGDVMFVISKDDEFTLSSVSQTLLGGPTKFGIIKPGITLVNTNNSQGVTTGATLTNGRIFWGTTSSAINSVNSENITGGILGNIPYQTTANSTSFVSPNITSTRKFLSQTGNGTISSTPEWLILPTNLPVAKNDGTVINIPVANGYLPVTDRNGITVNITVN